MLRQIGVEFSVMVADTDESVLDGEAPGDYAVRVAREKVLAVIDRAAPARPVLGADTAVVLDDCILGKPASRNEACKMLMRLSGRTHEVFSAVALAVDREYILDALNVSRVTFASLDDAWIESYLETGDSMDKAGAYGVQGRSAEKISRIEGSFSGVMGLPLFETSQLLVRAEVLF